MVSFGVVMGNEFSHAEPLHSTPRRGIKTGIKTALTQAERSQTVENSCDCPENQISVAAERQKQIPAMKLIKEFFAEEQTEFDLCPVSELGSGLGC